MKVNNKTLEIRFWAFVVPFAVCVVTVILIALVFPYPKTEFKRYSISVGFVALSHSSRILLKWNEVKNKNTLTQVAGPRSSWKGPME